MQKLLLTSLVLLFSSPVFAGFVNETNITDFSSVKNVLKMTDESFVTMKGNITKQIGNEKYLFTDGTGDIRVDIDDQLWGHLTVTKNTKVILKGEVDKDFNSIEVEVSSVEITN